MAHFDFVASDTGSKLVATCVQKGTTNAVDLSASTVKLRFWYQEDDVVRTRDMTVRSPANAGIAEYLFQTDELKAAGRMFCEVEVHDIGGEVVSQLDLAVYRVRPKHS